jgi:hypothetical protein
MLEGMTKKEIVEQTIQDLMDTNPTDDLAFTSDQVADALDAAGHDFSPTALHQIIRDMNGEGKFTGTVYPTGGGSNKWAGLRLRA